MKKPVTALIAVGLTVTPVSAATPDPATLAPSSPWNVNYADDYCRLARSFGTGNATTFVFFDRFAPGQDFKLVVAGSPFRNLGNAKVAEVRFGPDEQIIKVAYFNGDLGKDRPALIFRGSLRVNSAPPLRAKSGTEYEPSPISAERIAAVKELVIAKPLRRPIRFALGSMRAPFAALDKCVDDLLVHWGVDPARHATLSRMAAPSSNPGQWITSNDYPASAIFRGAQGVVEFRLSIDESGKPSACHIQQSTRPPEFDVIVCRNMMRNARFTPALDKDGKPVTSFYRSSVTFLMP